MLAISGPRGTIARRFLSTSDHIVVQTRRNARNLPLDCDEYLLCAGVLHGEQINDLSDEQLAETLRVNFTDVARFCDKLFAVNDHARVCVIGSYSGITGSYDMAYAGAKAALHLYVETKRLRTANQHLVAIAPTIIEDSGMTQRRTDLQATLDRGKDRRLGRWLQAAEVARIAHFALKEDALCNTVVRANGGNW